MKKLSPKVALDRSLADRVHNLASKGIDVQYKHLQLIDDDPIEIIDETVSITLNESNVLCLKS